MALRPVRKGDYFLAPFAGPRRDNLVLVLGKAAHGEGFWRVRYLGGGYTTTILIGSCHRCSPSLATRILKTKPTKKRDVT